MTSPFWIVAFAAFKVLRHAVWLFVIVVIDLVAAGYGGVPAIKEQFEKMPHGVARVRSGLRWAGLHPLPFTLDLAASVALGILLWRGFQTGSKTAPAWLNVLFAIGPALCALVVWPLIVGRLLRYRRLALGYAALLAVASLSLYRLPLPAPLAVACGVVVALPVVAFGVPVLLGILLAGWTLVLPVFTVIFVGSGLLFRALIATIGLEGIARILEGFGLVALGLAAYFTYSGPAGLGLTPHQVDGLAYAGALCGALSVGFTILSFLSERVRQRLGEKKENVKGKSEARA